MISNHNLFEKLWSFEELSSFSVKMNIVSNLLVSTAGFHAVNRYLSEICIRLYGTAKYITLVLNFVHNYFMYTGFSLHPESRVDLLI